MPCATSRCAMTTISSGAWSASQEAANDRGSGVVGEVGDHLVGGAWLYQGVDLDLSRVGLDDMQVAPITKLFRQSVGKGFVELHRDHSARMREKGGRQEAAPWTDLDDQVLIGQVRCLDDPAQHTAVDEKVLAQGFPRGPEVAASETMSLFRVSHEA